MTGCARHNVTFMGADDACGVCGVSAGCGLCNEYGPCPDCQLAFLASENPYPMPPVLRRIK